MAEDIEYKVVTEQSTAGMLVSLMLGLTALGAPKTMIDLLGLNNHIDAEISLKDPRFSQFQDVIETVKLHEARGATLRYQLLQMEDGSSVPTVQVIGYDPDLERGLQYAFFAEDEEDYEQNIAPFGLPTREIDGVTVKFVEFGVYLQLSPRNDGFSVKAFDSSRELYSEAVSRAGDLGLVEVPSIFADRTGSMQLLGILDRLGPISQAIVQRSDRVAVQESTVRLQRGMLRISEVERRLAEEAQKAKRLAAISFLNRIVGFAAEVVDFVSTESNRERAERSQKNMTRLLGNLKVNGDRLNRTVTSLKETVGNISDPSSSSIVEVYDSINDSVVGITSEWFENEAGIGAALKVINQDGTEDYRSGIILWKKP